MMHKLFAFTFAALTMTSVAVSQIKPSHPVPKVAKTQESPKPLMLNGRSMEFVQIAPGEFDMGEFESEGTPGSPAFFQSAELVKHLVRITKGFELGTYEVTQAQWEAVMGSNPSKYKGASLPVQGVSWEIVQEFLRRLNERGDGYRYRLPTEAEWEYAARAGKSEVVEEFGPSRELNAIDLEQPLPVGSKRPNAWGLHDMLGNVSEWCQDNYDERYYVYSPTEDPQGPSVGPHEENLHVTRGASYRDSGKRARLAYRSGKKMIDGTGLWEQGFRCAREKIPSGTDLAKEKEKQENQKRQTTLVSVFTNGAKGGEKTALDNLRKLAESGNVAAQYNLGVLYLQSAAGLLKDDGQALTWFRKAAEHGSAQAAFAEFWMYTRRESADYGLFLCLKAAELGHVEAQYLAGKFLLDNYRDGHAEYQGKFWQRKAAEHGFVKAEYDLADRLNMTRQFQDSDEWARKALAHGDARAQKLLEKNFDECLSFRRNAEANGWPNVACPTRP